MSTVWGVSLTHIVFWLVQVSRRSDSELVGRTDGNMIVVFPNKEVEHYDGSMEKMKPGEYVHIKVSNTKGLSRRREGM